MKMLQDVVINHLTGNSNMLKNILNLEGAQQLTNNEQKELNGGLKHVCKGGATWCDTNGAMCNEFSMCVNGCCQVI